MARTSKKAPAANLLPMPRVANKRRSYDDRTAQHCRAAKIAAESFLMKPAVEDENGFLVREWSVSDKLSVKVEDIARAISRARAVELEEMLEMIPLSGVKKALYAGWIVKDPVAPWFVVTKRAQAELSLPKKDRNGSTIKFFDAGRVELANGEAGKILRALGADA